MYELAADVHVPAFAEERLGTAAALLFCVRRLVFVKLVWNIACVTLGFQH